MRSPADPHAAAVDLLSDWIAPDPGQEVLRREFVDFLAGHADGVWRSCSPAHLTAGALIVDPERDRVLLLLHAKARLWLPAGGHCEPGDGSLAATALREAVEESGISDLVLHGDGTPLKLDRHPAPCRPGVADEHFDVQFLALAPPDAVPALSDESHDLAWFGYDELPTPTADDVHHLVAAARGRLAADGEPNGPGAAGRAGSPV
ncbi:8-oxo-dGTP pyrophosphatase MutT (NUDIX family) [Haloactinopolyspora alba]|uniref:8-oxo-dGTP pyrophosphatase MutT (NUDIX family) n=1 Tax=Haloactinopolyspora alba TaxID=648780 RepID=A0A2P8EB09_9ACTN|nr:NUDIX domain-containing protein [Haloactinopolyspora alba]PSL06627.1 8-oxo-dGTP pyrophosphatase MutT (NUDIX family) [Haloactinopolyspora alba]